jgi:uncharacterized protein (DUF1499 family)
MPHRLSVVLAIVGSLVGLSCTPGVPPPPQPPAPHALFLAPCPASPNCVSSQAADAEHYVEPLRIVGDPSQAMNELRRIIESIPRTRIVAVSDTALHAEFTSYFFGFVDDVDLQLDAASHLVQIRSASRTGYSDLGANRRRVETIRAAFERGHS